MFRKPKKNIVTFTPTMPFIQIKKQIYNYLIKKLRQVEQSKLYFNPSVTDEQKEVTRNQLKYFYESINNLNDCALLEDLFSKLLKLAKQCSFFLKIISDAKLNLLYEALLNSCSTLKQYENFIRSHSPIISLTANSKKTLVDMHRYKKGDNHYVYHINSIPLITQPKAEEDLKNFFKTRFDNREMIDFLLLHTHQDGLMKYGKYFIDYANNMFMPESHYVPTKFQVNFNNYGFYETIMDHTLIFSVSNLDKQAVSRPFLLTIRTLISQDSKNLPRVTGIEVITDENNINSVLNSIIDPKIKQIFKDYINNYVQKSFFEIENVDRKKSSNDSPKINI